MPDQLFRVAVLRKTPNPQQAIAAAMHQDYSEESVIEEIERGSFLLTEKEAGDRVVKHLLAGGRGHYGPLEHPQIIFNVGYFPHSVMQQLRTHRLCSFDVQSFRYTGQRIIDVAIGQRDVEEVFYLRPVGYYDSRQGKKYFYSEQQREEDKAWCLQACDRYRQRIEEGLAEEHARSLIPFDARQHFVMSCNVRSLMHILDLRLKKDAQLECQQCCELMYEHFVEWCPEIAAWYDKNRKLKGKLAP